MIAFEDEFGVTKQIGIVHDDGNFQAAKEKYPERIIW